MAEQRFKELVNQLQLKIKREYLWWELDEKKDESQTISYRDLEDFLQLNFSLSLEDIKIIRQVIFGQDERADLKKVGQMLKINVVDQSKSITYRKQQLGSLEHKPSLRQQQSVQKTFQNQSSEIKQPSMVLPSKQYTFQNSNVSGMPHSNQNESRQSLQSIKSEQEVFQTYRREPTSLFIDEQQHRDMNNSLDKQIDNLFDEIDVDKNEYLDPKELSQALQRLGINPTPTELQQYFELFDKNHDEKISRVEFNQIIMDQVMKTYLSTEDIVTLIRIEFQLLSDANANELDQAQLQRVFHKIGLKLENADIIDLFAEIDLDRSGFVELTELTSFLMKPFSNHTHSAQSLLIRLADTKKISIENMKDLFKGIPSNFAYSFLVTANKRNQNLPSSAISPLLDPSGLTYKNYQLIQAQKYNLQNQLLDKTQFVPDFLYEIKLNSSIGLPSVDYKLFDPGAFLYREAGICLFDNVTKNFIGNTVYIPTNYNFQEPDQWLFLKDISVLMAIQADPKKQLSIVIEFIVHYRAKDALHPLSISFGQIDLKQIKGNMKMSLELKGGTPYSPFAVEPVNIRVSKGLFKKQPTFPVLDLELIQIPIKEKPKYCQLPINVLVNKRQLGFIFQLREYIAYRSICKGVFDPSLPDFKIRAILNLLDLPEFGQKLCDWWVQNFKLQTHKEMLNFMDELGQRAYLMLQRTDFSFRVFPLTQRLYHKIPIMNQREKCFQEFLFELTKILGNQSNKSIYYQMEPTMIADFDEFDDDTLEKISKAQRRKRFT